MYINESDPNCQRVTHLSREEYKKLEVHFKKCAMETTYKGHTRRRHKTSKIADGDVLLIYLYYCSTYPPFWALSFNLGVKQRCLAKILKRASVALYKTAFDPDLTFLRDGALHPPTPDEVKELKERQAGMHNPGLEGADVCLDGYFNIIRALHAQHGTLWSHRHHAFGVPWLTVTTLFGLSFLNIGPADTVSEQHLLKSSDLREILVELGLGVITDAGFTFNPKQLTPDKLVKHFFTVGPGTLAWLRALVSTPGVPEEIRMNAKQALHSTSLAAQMRAVVENHNALMRAFPILAHKFRQWGKGGLYSLVLEHVVGGLRFVRNRRMLNHPLRAPGWTPQGSTTPGAKYGYPANITSGQSANKTVTAWVASLPEGVAGLVVRARKGIVEADGIVEDAADLDDIEAEQLKREYADVEGDILFDRLVKLKKREPMDDKKEHVVVGQYDSLDKAEGKRKFRKRARSE
jgi:hypothetical protein